MYRIAAFVHYPVTTCWKENKILEIQSVSIAWEFICGHFMIERSIAEATEDGSVKTGSRYDKEQNKLDRIRRENWAIFR